MSDLKIRQIQKEEYPLLEDFDDEIFVKLMNMDIEDKTIDLVGRRDLQHWF